MFVDLFKKTLTEASAYIRSEKKLFLILLFAFVLRLIYVYFCTDYKTYLFSDMGAYWQRALDRYNRDVHNYGQWAAWAPFFHYYITFLFQIFDLTGLSKFRLEIVLFLNIVYSVVSIYFFYLLTGYFIKDNFFRLVSTLFYALAYPLLYLNVFVLSENFSIPIIITSAYLILKYHENKKMLFFTGAFFALAVCARPAIGLLAAPFFLYVVFADKPSFESLMRGVIFSCGFFLITGMVSLENMKVSNGELKGLAANGGLGFFVQQCKAHMVRSEYKGYVFEIGNPTYLGHSELAKMDFRTDHSLHDEDYFYKQGFECIKKNPNIWIENFVSLKSMFIGPLFPSVPGCKGFDFLIKFSNYFFIFIFPSLFLLYFPVRDKLMDLKMAIFLVSMPFLVIIVNYFYAVEQRYFYPCVFALFISFFSFLQYKPKYEKVFKIYLGIMLAVLLFIRF
jgi:hypothetical protein